MFIRKWDWRSIKNVKCFEIFQAISHCRLAWKGICVCLSSDFFSFFIITFEEKFLQETNMSANNTYTGSFMALLSSWKLSALAGCTEAELEPKHL